MGHLSKEQGESVEVLEYNAFLCLWFSFSICHGISTCYLTFPFLRHGNCHQVSAALTGIRGSTLQFVRWASSPPGAGHPPPATKHRAQVRSGNGTLPLPQAHHRSWLSVQLTSKGLQPWCQGMHIKVMPAPLPMAATILPCLPHLDPTVPGRGREQGWGDQAGWHLGEGSGLLKTHPGETGRQHEAEWRWAETLCPWNILYFLTGPDLWNIVSKITLLRISRWRLQNIKLPKQDSFEGKVLVVCSWKQPWEYENPSSNGLKRISFPGGSDCKEFTYKAGDLGSISGLGRSPGVGMETHSSILAWRISWSEEPGGLQSMGSQRVRHNWATNTFIFSQSEEC